MPKEPIYLFVREKHNKHLNIDLLVYYRLIKIYDPEYTQMCQL